MVADRAPSSHPSASYMQAEHFRRHASHDYLSQLNGINCRSDMHMQRQAFWGIARSYVTPATTSRALRSERLLKLASHTPSPHTHYSPCASSPTDHHSPPREHREHYFFARLRAATQASCRGGATRTASRRAGREMRSRRSSPRPTSPRRVCRDGRRDMTS